MTNNGLIFTMLSAIGIILILIPSMVVNIYAQIIPGMIPSQQTQNLPLGLTKWGPSNLELDSTKNETTFTMHISGSTGNNASGFFTNRLNYSGDSISLMVQDLELQPNDAQMSLGFLLVGNNGEGREVRYVAGPLPVSYGWNNEVFYEKLEAGLNANISLQGITENDTYNLRGLYITIKANSTVDTTFDLTFQ